MKYTKRSTKHKGGKTRKQIGDKMGGTIKRVNQKEFDSLIKKMLELLTLLRLYHWNTLSHSVHKSTGDLYDKLSDKVDEYVETMIGKSNGKYRINMSNYSKLTINGVSNNVNMGNTIKTFINLLNVFHSQLPQSFYSDVINIKDEIVAELDKYLYQLTLK